MFSYNVFLTIRYAHIFYKWFILSNYCMPLWKVQIQLFLKKVQVNQWKQIKFFFFFWLSYVNYIMNSIFWSFKDQNHTIRKFLINDTNRAPIISVGILPGKLELLTVFFASGSPTPLRFSGWRFSGPEPWPFGKLSPYWVRVTWKQTNMN